MQCTTGPDNLAVFGLCNQELNRLIELRVLLAICVQSAGPSAAGPVTLARRAHLVRRAAERLPRHLMAHNCWPGCVLPPLVPPITGSLGLTGLERASK